jgi:C-terminal processing protease CtpA/Prc
LGAYGASAGRGTLTGVVISPGETTSDLRLVLRRDESTSDPILQGSLAITLGEAAGEVIVVQIADLSEAERSGLKVGDAILEVDGQPTASMSVTRTRLNGPAGTGVVLKLKREDQTLTVHVTREAVRR